MTGLDKITSQIQEEAEASAKERIEAAQKEAEQICLSLIALLNPICASK